MKLVLASLLVLTVAWTGSAATNLGGSTEVVAVVLAVSGQAEVRAPAAESSEVARAMLALVSGTELRVAPGSWLVLGLTDGRRLRLLGNTEAVLEDHDLRLIRGDVESLGEVPALTRLVPVLVAENACTTRVRAERTRRKAPLGLQPASQTTVARSEVVVRFAPPPGYGRFRIVLLKELNGQVMELDTSDSSVQVSAEVLEPDTGYVVTVTSLDPGQPRLFQAAGFRTLTERIEAAREALIEQSSRGDEESLAAMLRAVDTALCLDHPGEAADAIPGF